MTRMVIQELDHELRPKGLRSFHPRGGGWKSVEEMQHSLFRRVTGPGIDNRLIKFIPNGVIIIEFTCANFRYRNYDFGDYNFGLAQRITLEEDL